jgi:dihydrofolate synthase/folylpolyglutamate synthase
VSKVSQKGTSFPTKSTFSIAAYREAVAFVEGFSNISYRKCLNPQRADLSFFIDRTRYFLKLLGSPEKKLRFVHVTGTAGKGTVSSMIHEILLAGGQKAGLFTSPYVTTTIEKIKVNDQYISPAEFIRLVEYMKPFIRRAAASKYGPPSAFEILVVMALLYFKKENCRWVVMEVGLGGRYDATNVIPADKVAVITNIDYDHTEILGKTLARIAFDKAGIISRECSFFTSERRPSLLRLFRRVCKDQKADFHSIVKTRNARRNNAALARAVGSHLGFSRSVIEAGIGNSRLPCRFEVVGTRPYVILDGAHNRAKICCTVNDLAGLTYKRLFSIISLSNMRKDNLAIIEPLARISNHVIITTTSKKDRRSVHPRALLPYVLRHKKRGATVKIIEDSAAAYRSARRRCGARDCILVSGSFFLAGEIRKLWYPEKWVLRNRRSF